MPLAEHQPTEKAPAQRSPGQLGDTSLGTQGSVLGRWLGVGEVGVGFITEIPRWREFFCMGRNLGMAKSKEEGWGDEETNHTVSVLGTVSSAIHFPTKTDTHK